MSLIHSLVADVQQQLAHLGLDQDDLSEAVIRGALARSECTPNHPPLHAGFVTWSNTVCALREVLIPKGWDRSDEGNYSTVIHPSGKIAIAVATGDENTGNPNANPMTKSTKGPITRNAVAMNIHQVSLFPELIPLLPTTQLEGRITWLLLVSQQEGKVKSELSLPTSCEGKVDGWKERLILPDIDLDPTSSFNLMPNLPSLPEIEIYVQRRG